MDTPTPVAAVSSVEITQMSPGSITEAMTQLPQFYASSTAATFNGANNGFFGSPGGGSLNLRGIGSKRTLTLLNGRRVVPASIYGGPDINSFPESMLQDGGDGHGRRQRALRHRRRVGCRSTTSSIRASRASARMRRRASPTWAMARTRSSRCPSAASWASAATCCCRPSTPSRTRSRPSRARLVSGLGRAAARHRCVAELAAQRAGAQRRVDRGVV